MLLYNIVCAASHQQTPLQLRWKTIPAGQEEIKRTKKGEN